MTTKAEGSWRFREMLAGVKERTVDSLEQIAAMDQKVAPIRTMDDMIGMVDRLDVRPAIESWIGCV